ncbi:hypothetical protein MtrunA17_Chr5g0436441 [Medicago truncatula]|uniref:Uncharacterized protein n=1 Tax=Medicago truncatula TaxID=3880 RepID=A0A396HX57_MEDTR|nr:hypothetical protein MtrunA17_Chr5g0436441 [Medicago truncatula]
MWVYLFYLLGVCCLYHFYRHKQVTKVKEGLEIGNFYRTLTYLTK